MSLIRALTLGIVLAVGAGSVARAADDIDPATIQAANTPAAHQALADQYTALAAEAAQHSKHHIAMGKTYLSDKYKANAAHCKKLAADYADQAKEYEALAALHAKMAK